MQDLKQLGFQLAIIIESMFTWTFVNGALQFVILVLSLIASSISLLRLLRKKKGG